MLLWKIGFSSLQAERWAWLPALINWKVAAAAAVFSVGSVRFPRHHEDNSDSASVPSRGVLLPANVYEEWNHSRL